MCLKYCDGSARKAETIWGWGRNNVQLGLEEERSGIICLGTQAMFTGVQKWEQKHPDVAMVLKEIAEAHCQQEPSFKTSIADTRLTASEAISQLQDRGFGPEQIPAPSTMALILNRMGDRWKKVLKAKPQKAVRERSADGVSARGFSIRSGTRTKTKFPKPMQSLTTGKIKIRKM